jgi:hypothetical protein
VFARIFTNEHHLSNVRFCLGMAFKAYEGLATGKIKLEDHNRLSHVASLLGEPRLMRGLTILVSHLPGINNKESAITHTEGKQFPEPTSRMPGSTIVIFQDPLTLSDSR